MYNIVYSQHSYFSNPYIGYRGIEYLKNIKKIGCYSTGHIYVQRVYSTFFLFNDELKQIKCDAKLLFEKVDCELSPSWEFFSGFKHEA